MTDAAAMQPTYTPAWVARQLGHSDTTMIKKHYGRWIPRDTRSMAGMVSQMMGFNADTSGLDNSDSAPILPQGKRQNEKSPDESGPSIGGEGGIRTL